MDGAAHAKPHAADRLRPSSFATTVCVLQSAAGAAKWPVTAGLRKALTQAFHDALPATSDAERRAATGGGDAVAQLLQRRRAAGERESHPAGKKAKRSKAA